MVRVYLHCTLGSGAVATTSAVTAAYANSTSTYTAAAAATISSCCTGGGLDGLLTPEAVLMVSRRVPARILSACIPLV